MYGPSSKTLANEKNRILIRLYGTSPRLALIRSQIKSLKSKTKQLTSIRRFVACRFHIRVKLSTRTKAVITEPLVTDLFWCWMSRPYSAAPLSNISHTTLMRFQIRPIISATQSIVVESQTISHFPTLSGMRSGTVLSAEVGTRSKWRTRRLAVTP